MGKLELTRMIAAPPKEVFVFFVPQRMPYWYGVEMNSCFEMEDGATDFAVGRKVRISGKLGRKDVSHTAVVTGFTPGRMLEWRFRDAAGVRGTERWELEPMGAEGNGTMLRFTDQYELPGRFGPLVDWLLTRHALALRNRDYTERLAKLAERRG